MFNGHDWMWGMHWGWLILWIVATVAIVLLIARSRSTRPRRKTPLEVLEQRYAAGEISTEDYEERKSRLQKNGDFE
ncbi:MAG: SHOCT domain-containing protein [Rhodothermales bacterium]